MRFFRFPADERFRVISAVIAAPFLVLPLILGSVMLIEQGSILNLDFVVLLGASIAAAIVILIYGRGVSRTLKTLQK